MYVGNENDYKDWRAGHGYKQSQWPHKATCITPFKKADWLAQTIIGAMKTTNEAALYVEPILSWDEIDRVRKKYGEERKDASCKFYLGKTNYEIKDLLAAAFTDHCDFVFFPYPKSFVVVADHDEYTTFLGNKKSAISQIVLALKESGVKFVDYELSYAI